MARISPSFPCSIPSTDLPEVVTGSLAPDSALRGSVLLLGNFDGFHRGHQMLARYARRIARGRPVAVMSCEPHPRSFFGTESVPFRLATPGVKQRLLARHGIDFIFSPRFDGLFAGLSPEDFVDGVLVEALGVAAVIAGPDFHFGRRRSGNMEMLAEMGLARGFAVESAPELTIGGSRASSSLIRMALQAGDMRSAARMLGSGWLVECGAADDGGLMLDPLLCRPRAGVYLGRAADASAVGGGTRIEITADGRLIPRGPRALDDLPRIWRLESQV